MTNKNWIDLTDEEFEYCCSLKSPGAIAEEVEAKLKKKNMANQHKPLTATKITSLVNKEFGTTKNRSAMEKVCAGWFKIGLRAGEFEHGIKGCA